MLESSWKTERECLIDSNKSDTNGFFYELIEANGLINMISVIIPIFNVKQYVEEAIDSVLRQSYTNIEVILVDDGSTDGCSEICDKYLEKDGRIRVLHQQNRGLSAARNSGLNICIGEKIAFLDSDDAFCRDALLKMSEAMDASGTDIVECKYALSFGDGKLDEKKINEKVKRTCKESVKAGLYEREDALNAQIKGEIVCNVWNKLYKRHIWEELRFREGQNFEDKDIILQLLGKANTVYALNEKLVMHRKRMQSITTSYNIKNLRDMEAADVHYLERILEYTPQFFDEKVYKEVLNCCLNVYLLKYYLYTRFCKNDKDECLTYIQKLIDNMVHKIDINECQMRTRVAYAVYRHTPLFLYLFVSTPYYCLANLVKRAH